MISTRDEFFVASQRLAPHHALSRCAGWFASSKNPLIKNAFIRWFCSTYGPDMSEAEIEDPLAYANFNEFFTRSLKPGARPIDTDPLSVVSPADGVLSQYGQITNGRIVQAKGQAYSLRELLGDDAAGQEAFADGEFATVYLSPKDYHRVHMPLAGRLSRTVHVPGRLFSVNSVTTQAVPRLFARNERVICYFDSDIGPMAVILVGAMIVASIETVWAGLITPVPSSIRHIDYRAEKTTDFSKGAEMGRFFLGSTVIVLLPRSTISWSPELAAGGFVRMGQSLAQLKK